MLRLSKKVDYGLVLLSKLCTERTSASAREIAQRYQLPLPMIANILKALAAAGVLASTRGAQGGYELARPAGRITLAQVVEALDGPFNLVDCVADEERCKFARVCPTHDPIQVVHHKFQSFMEELTLAEILGSSGRSFKVGLEDNENTYLPG